jgi:hypothetical protein
VQEVGTFAICWTVSIPEHLVYLIRVPRHDADGLQIP